MPSEHQAGTSDDRPRYPEIEAEYGEDPARFLYRGTINEETPDDDYGAGTIGGLPLALAIARIRGIESLELAQLWRRVEFEITGGDPRTHVLDLIEDRIEYLEHRDQTQADAAATAGGEA